MGPSGPDTAEVVGVGEAPGKDENRWLIPFVGKTGLEVNQHYMPLAGLSRDSVIITNAIQCLPNTSQGRLDPKRTKDIDLLESCANNHLRPLLKRVKPRVIIAMGRFACMALDRDLDLDLHHGMPMETAYGTVFVMYHPALGIHEPKRMLHIRNDWIRLRHYLNNNLKLPQDQYPNPDYREATAADINDIDPTLPMANDTESSRLLGPYFLTYSQQPGTGRLIRASNKLLLAAFKRKLKRWESILLWHNWMYDKKPVTEMGLEYPDKAIRDTMIRAFHLGNLPQGLKALCLRELGMTMQDFEDLVRPYSLPEVLDYYIKAMDIDWPKPEEELVRDDKTGLWKLYKPQSMKTKLKRFFTDYGKNVEKDPIEMWDNWEHSHAMMEEKLGPWPGLDIAHVPEHESFHYAMRDSDGTLRLWPVLEHMKEAAISGKPQERWRE